MMKGKVCVTGGTGYVASWLVMKLLERGYSVNTTVRPGTKKDTSFLTNLPGASENLRIFNADLDNPETFSAAIEGCIGVFHLAHSIDFENKESEETVTNKSIAALLSILKVCVDSKTVKRVVYTSSVSTVMFNGEEDCVLDESSWSDADYIRRENLFGASYYISKMLTEKAALEFAEKHSLDLVTVIPTWINGPFVCPNVPPSVRATLAMILGAAKLIKFYKNMPYVHTDDVASAHIFLFENPEAKGRYICSAVEITLDKLNEFLPNRYPEFKIEPAEADPRVKFVSLSSKKLLEAGFEYKYSLEEIFDGAIECCKQRGVL